MTWNPGTSARRRVQRGAITGHLSADEAGPMAAHDQVERLVLVHLPHFGELDPVVERARWV